MRVRASSLPALAVTARRRGLDTLLVDADPLGGGVDLVLGWEQMAGLRWPELVDARGRVSPPALVSALPGEGSLAVLSFDRSELDAVPVDAMAAALDAGRRGRDLVVVDLPRRFDDASLVALTAADRGYLVVPAELRACAAARRVAAAASIHCAELSVVVRDPSAGWSAAGRNRRGARPPLVRHVALRGQAAARPGERRSPWGQRSRAAGRVLQASVG